MTGYEVLEIGSPDEWLAQGKRFADKEMDTQYIGVSANALEPGGEAPLWHTHSRLEELYFFLAGRGQMALDDDVIDVGPGSVVRVGQGVWRTLRATPESPGELRWLCIRSGGGELKEVSGDSERDAERPRPW